MQIFKNFSVNEFAHDDEALVRAETLVIAGAGGESYELVAAGDAHAEVEKAHIHSGLGDGGNVNVVAVDIEAEVLGEGDGENFKCVDAAVGGEVDVLVFGDEVLIGERHKGLELAAGFLEGHEAVIPVVTVDYGVLGELAAAKVRGLCRPGNAAGLVIGGGGGALPDGSVLYAGALDREVGGYGLVLEGIAPDGAGVAGVRGAADGGLGKAASGFHRLFGNGLLDGRFEKVAVAGGVEVFISRALKVGVLPCGRRRRGALDRSACGNFLRFGGESEAAEGYYRRKKQSRAQSDCKNISFPFGAHMKMPPLTQSKI